MDVPPHDGTPVMGRRAAQREEDEAGRLYEEAVGEVSPGASPDEEAPDEARPGR